MRKYYFVLIFIGVNEEEFSRFNLVMWLVVCCYSFNDCGFKYLYKIIVV